MKKLKNPGGDSAQDILRPRQHPLDVFFEPESVALIGATENPGSVGRTVLWNLISTPFGGTVYPVNPKRASVLGIKAYPNIAAVPEQVDLAVITTPAATVPSIIRQCVDAGVKAAIVISAGFKELGKEGQALENQVLEEARRGNLRIIGPNCLGVMSPLTGLNATFARAMALPGNVGFISQSGALCTAVLDWSLREQVGRSMAAMNSIHIFSAPFLYGGEFGVTSGQNWRSSDNPGGRFWRRARKVNDPRRRLCLLTTGTTVALVCSGVNCSFAHRYCSGWHLEGVKSTVSTVQSEFGTKRR
jgi:predicted CoA-binding protein